MNATAIAKHALDLPDTTEDTPFGPDTDVFKVHGKVFGILEPGSDGHPGRLTLKCDPAVALDLRAEYDAVTAGYHMNKDHWNSVRLDGSVPAEDLGEMIEHSYDRVVDGLPRAVRDRLRLRRRG